MQLVLIVLIGLHILGGVFWAGSTFAIVRSGGAGAPALFGPQMGAATITFLAGVGLWAVLHRGPGGPMEHTLTLGALCAIAAAGVQGATRKKNPMKGQRIAAGLLLITVISMAVARYVG
ncbi:MAG: hypothetical protein QOI59_6586 [Gammaproteobacteria bacterium]|jgi:hypothetical protein|nr:hypothetical protein [Gammaproteobacteria bacterium]